MQVQLGTLLPRSQDLTAVVLAVEQLTGAVAANQVLLTGSAGSSSVASLTANQQALEAARAAENQANDKVAAAESAKAEQDKIAARTAQEFADASSAVVQEESKQPKNDAEIGRLKTIRSEKETADKSAQLKAKELGRDLEQAKLNHGDAKKLRETIEAIQSSSVASAASNTTGSGGFTVVAPRREMSAEATKEIAAAVKEMVIKALDREDILPTCLGVLGWAAEEEQAVSELVGAAAIMRRDPDSREAPEIANSLEDAVSRLNSDARKSGRNQARALCLEILSEATRKAIARGAQ